MFVLKRLSDAVAENDNILGVIRGIEVNQSANAESITQPHIPTQVSLFEKLVTKAGVKTTDISVVEAHGTGEDSIDLPFSQFYCSLYTASDQEPKLGILLKFKASGPSSHATVRQRTPSTLHLSKRTLDTLKRRPAQRV